MKLLAVRGRLMGCWKLIQMVRRRPFLLKRVSDTCVWCTVPSI
jgi:hypothetical protein